MPDLNELHLYLERHLDGCTFLSTRSSGFFGALTIDQKVPVTVSAVSILQALSERLMDIYSVDSEQWMATMPLHLVTTTKH